MVGLDLPDVRVIARIGLGLLFTACGDIKLETNNAGRTAADEQTHPALTFRKFVVTVAPFCHQSKHNTGNCTYGSIFSPQCNSSFARPQGKTRAHKHARIHKQASVRDESQEKNKKPYLVD